MRMHRHNFKWIRWEKLHRWFGYVRDKSEAVSGNENIDRKDTIKPKKYCIDFIK